jgi:hypothetical protein
LPWIAAHETTNSLAGRRRRADIGASHRLNHFTTSQTNALIAPRAHLSLAGARDQLAPLKGLDVIDAELAKTYAAAGHSQNWKLMRYDVGHQEAPEMRAAVRQGGSRSIFAGRKTAAYML